MPKIVQKKDGYYVKLKNYDTGPLPTLEEAQKRAEIEILIETSGGFSVKRYLYSLLGIEVAMVAAGSILKWDLLGFGTAFFVVFILHSVFSMLAALLGK